MDASPVTGDRLFVITPDDRRGTIWVVSIICLVYIFLLLLLRATARRNSFGGDDWIAVGSTVAGTVHYALTFTATSNGLGRVTSDIGPREAELTGSVLLAHDAFFILTLFLTKCSAIYLCRRLFSINMKRHILFCDAAICFSALWCIASIVTLLVRCDSLQRLSYEGSQCPNTLTRWKAIGIVDAITEFFVVILACVVVTPLKMQTGAKVSALSSFLPRLLLIPLIALRLQALQRSLQAPAGENTLANPTIYAEVQLIYAVFSAAVPAVNRWLRKFDTKMGGHWTTSSGAYGSGDGYARNQSRTHVRSYPLNTIGSQVTGSAIHSNSQPDTLHEHGGAQLAGPDSNFRPDNVAYTWQTQVPVTDTDHSSGQSRNSQGSAGSQANIIRKDVQWHVRYDHRCDSEDPRGVAVEIRDA